MRLEGVQESKYVYRQHLLHIWSSNMNVVRRTLKFMDVKTIGTCDMSMS